MTLLLLQVAPATRAGAASAAQAALLQTAEAALSEGLFDVAERHLVRYLVTLQGEPERSVQPLLWLCRALSGQGRHDEIVRLLAANPDVVAAGWSRGGFAYWQARALYEAGRIAEVATTLQGVELESMEPGYRIGLERLLARTAIAGGDYAAARRAFAVVDQLATEREVRAANLLEWAQAELADDNSDECEKLLQRQATLATTNIPSAAISLGQLLQGQLARRRGRSAEAEVLLRRLAEEPATPLASRSEAWLELAEMALAAGDTNGVVAASRQILDPALGTQHAWRMGLRYGRLLLVLPEQLTTGAALLKQVIRDNPGAAESAAAQYALGEAWLAAGSNRQAAAEFRNYLETYGDVNCRADALHGEATALLRLGSHNEAATLYQQAARAATSAARQATALLHAADANHAAKRYEEATTLYLQVAAMTNNFDVAGRASFMAADALERLGRSGAAERAFSALAASEASGGDIAEEALLRTALLQERREAVGEAVAAYSRLIATTTNQLRLAEALLGRGRSTYRNYQFENSIPDLKRVGKVVPAMAATADYLRMLALYGAGRDEEALEVGKAFAGAYPGAPELPQVALWLAQYHYNSRDFATSQQQLTDFAARWPQHPQADAALVWAGRAALQRGELSDAITLLARLSRTYPASERMAEARFLQAEALGELARFEEAVLVLDEIINRYPESEIVTTAWLRKGDSLVALGSSATNRYEEALRAYDVVARRPDAAGMILLEAAYKRGRALERMGRVAEAIDQYYTGVVLRYQGEGTAGAFPGAQAEEWYARAIMQMAALEEGRGQSEAAIRLLKRLTRSDMAGAAEAAVMIRQIERAESTRWPATTEELER